MQNNSKHRKMQRQIEAEDRKAARAKRSDADQLNVLWERGVDCGREHDRLVANIVKQEASAKGKK